MIRDENKRLSVLVESILQTSILDKGEFKLTGEIKSKNQDVCVINPHLIHCNEISPTGQVDEYGRLFTE